MKKILTLILLVISINLYAQTNDILNYIRQNAVALNVTDANIGYDDLMPLKTILSNRRIIGMGEATHGTHEFQTEKFRMFRFLVQEMGFRIFALEANFTECRAINNYVLYGKGDPREAIKGIYFWVWGTQEMLQVIEWMRNYNIDKAENDKVKFYGFDMQFSQVAAASVALHLRKLDSSYYNTHFRRIDSLKIAEMSIKGITKAQYDSLSNIFKTAVEYVEKQHIQLLKLYNNDELEYLQRDIRLLQQSLDEYSFPENQKGYYYRDKYMAENVEWILQHEGENSKIMLCAHNGHIDKSYYPFPVRGKKTPHMGNYLKEQYKDQYYAIGFDFNNGGFRARDIDKPNRELTNFIVNDAETGSSGKVFSEMNMPAFFINIDNVIKTKSQAKTFFTKSIRHRSIGAVFSADKKKGEELYYEDNPLYTDYDGLIFINATTPTLGI